MKDEKMKDREMWMDKLKEKLENYSEPIPPFGWEQLEKELVPPVKKRILYPYRRWGAAATSGNCPSEESDGEGGNRTLGTCRNCYMSGGRRGKPDTGSRSERDSSG